MNYFPQATKRSSDLLLSFPDDVLQLIIQLVLANDLYHSENNVFIHSRLSCRVLSFRHIIGRSKRVRGVCSSWARVTRFILFRGKATRAGLVPILPHLLLEEEIKTFPLLRDCMVNLCHPYWLRELYTLHQRLLNSPGSLEFVCAITWDGDELMDVMRGRVDSMGYGRFGHEFVSAFTNECIAAGLKIADCVGKRPNGGSKDSDDSEQVEEAAIRAMKTFFFKETIALWYYNAHMVRQILSLFPFLEYAEFPDFLLVPLVARMKYFFPQCTDDDSPFAAISFSPPQMLQNLGIAYREQGRRYSDLFASVKVLNILTPHYNPILALFSCNNSFRVPVFLLPLLIFNRWCGRNGTDCDVPADIIERIKNVISEAISDIPAGNNTQLFNIEKLRHVMDEPDVDVI